MGISREIDTRGRIIGGRRAPMTRRLYTDQTLLDTTPTFSVWSKVVMFFFFYFML